MTAPMPRCPEPELMDDPVQARAYALADFSEPHQRFVDRFRSDFGAHRPCRVLDLGCGPADVTRRFALAYPRAHVLGIDAAEAMLRHGRAAIAGAGLGRRIELVLGRLPGAGLPAHRFDTIISNSLLHHLRDPASLWRGVGDAARPGAAVFVMDLRRPPSLLEAADLVETYAGGESDILKCDFFRSLRAAYTVREVVAQLRHAGLERLRVRAVGDRHLVVFGHVPGTPGA